MADDNRVIQLLATVERLNKQQCRILVNRYTESEIMLLFSDSRVSKARGPPITTTDVDPAKSLLEVTDEGHFHILGNHYAKHNRSALRIAAMLNLKKHISLLSAEEASLARTLLQDLEAIDEATRKILVTSLWHDNRELLLEVFMVKLKKRQRIASVVAAGDKTAELLKAFMDTPRQYRKPAIDLEILSQPDTVKAAILLEFKLGDEELGSYPTLKYS
jgi:hypothetical protein